MSICESIPRTVFTLVTECCEASVKYNYTVRQDFEGKESIRDTTYIKRYQQIKDVEVKMAD